jgi:hypothetical protein
MYARKQRLQLCVLCGLEHPIVLLPRYRSCYHSLKANSEDFIYSRIFLRRLCLVFEIDFGVPRFFPQGLPWGKNTPRFFGLSRFILGSFANLSTPWYPILLLGNTLGYPRLFGKKSDKTTHSRCLGK